MYLVCTTNQTSIPCSSGSHFLMNFPAIGKSVTSCPVLYLIELLMLRVELTNCWLHSGNFWKPMVKAHTSQRLPIEWDSNQIQWCYWSIPFCWLSVLELRQLCFGRFATGGRKRRNSYAWKWVEGSGELRKQKPGNLILYILFCYLITH